MITKLRIKNKSHKLNEKNSQPYMALLAKNIEGDDYF